MLKTKKNSLFIKNATIHIDLLNNLLFYALNYFLYTILKNEDNFLEWCKENNLIHKIIGYSEDQYEL